MLSIEKFDFSAVLRNMLYKAFLTFESAGEIHKSDHSNESC